MKTTSIILGGVGGQGTILAGKLLGRLLMEQGYDVKVSEIHGMSQRGGSVVTYIRYGDRVCSPTVEPGEADYVITFELCESARWCHFLAPGGHLISATQRISPMPVITGAAVYPDDIEKELAGLDAEVRLVDALAAAEKAGSAKAVNMVLMGALSRCMDIDESRWYAAMGSVVKPQFLELNRKAFAIGHELCS